MADKTPPLPDTPDDARRIGTSLSGGAIATIAGVALLVVFMVQNTEQVAVTFLFWDLTWPLWLLVLGAAALGGMVWFGLGVFRRRRRRAAQRNG